MATKPSPSKPDFTMPIPPPQIHARSTNEYPSPSTPTYPGFISPSETPQGSPSKKQLPPGSHELPDVFENALKLNPTQGNANTGASPKTPHSPTSPSKGGRTPLSDHPVNDFRNSVLHDGKANKQPLNAARGNENTPPGAPRPAQDPSFANSAAASRHDAYQRKSYQGPTTRSMHLGLSSEDLEKLQKPSVKRLANVTQLCKSTPGGLVLLHG